METTEKIVESYCRYGKIIVAWGSTPGAKAKAKEAGIELWEFPDLLLQIAAAYRDHKAYFTDDTARTIHFSQWQALAASRSKHDSITRCSVILILPLRQNPRSSIHFCWLAR